MTANVAYVILTLCDNNANSWYTYSNHVLYSETMKKVVAAVNLSNHYCMNQDWCRFVCDILSDPSNVMQVIICCTTHFGGVGVQFQG